MINGLESTDDVTWTVWKNGKKELLGLERIRYEDGDTFVYKYDSVTFK